MKTWLVMLTLALLIAPVLAAQCTETEFLVNTPRNITVLARYDNGTLATGATCQLYQFFPNGSVAYDFAAMSSAGNATYNYTATPVTTGQWPGTANCSMGAWAGVTDTTFVSVSVCTQTTLETTNATANNITNTTNAILSNATNTTLELNGIDATLKTLGAYASNFTFPSIQTKITPAQGSNYDQYILLVAILILGAIILDRERKERENGQR